MCSVLCYLWGTHCAGGTKVASSRCLLMQQQTVERTLSRYGFVQNLPLPPFPDSAIQRPARSKSIIQAGSSSFTRKVNTLELAFDSKALRTICESEGQAKLELGVTVAESLKHRLADLVAATSTNDLLAGRPRVCANGRDMVLDLCNGHVIVFTANHVNNPMTETNIVDWARVTRIKILRIESDHG